MKNLNLLVFLFLSMLSNTAFSQLSQGTFRIGPILSFNSSTSEIDGLDDKFKTINLNLGLSGGYYVIDNFEIGVEAAVTSTKSKLGADETKENGLSIGPIVSYMVSLYDKLYLPIIAGVGFNSVKVNDDISETTYSGMVYGIGAGLEYLVGNKLGARLLLSTNFGSLGDTDSSDEINLKGSKIGLGVNFYFSR